MILIRNYCTLYKHKENTDKGKVNCDQRRGSRKRLGLRAGGGVSDRGAESRKWRGDRGLVRGKWEREKPVPAKKVPGSQAKWLKFGAVSG